MTDDKKRFLDAMYKSFEERGRELGHEEAYLHGVMYGIISCFSNLPTEQKFINRYLIDKWLESENLTFDEALMMPDPEPFKIF